MTAASGAVPEAAEAFTAFCATLTHACRSKDGSRFESSPDLWLLDETRVHENPWPRPFLFRKSLYALGERVGPFVGRVRSLLDEPDEEHVLNFFCPDPEGVGREAEAHGYELSWIFDLFAKELRPGSASPELPPGFVLVHVDSPALVDAINARGPEYPSSRATLGDPAFHEIAILEGGSPVAKGAIVCGPPGFVQLLDMVTFPTHRRRGLGRRVAEALHREAARRGARWSVLNASRMAADTGFYPRLGYESALRCARLVRSAATTSGSNHE